MSSQDETTKLKEILGNCLNSLREEFKQMRDRGRQLGQVQPIIGALAKYEEDLRKSCAKLCILADKTKETCSNQKEEILKLQQQLIAEKEKSEMAASETRKVVEDKQRTIDELQVRLADKEFQVMTNDPDMLEGVV